MEHFDSEFSSLDEEITYVDKSNRENPTSENSFDDDLTDTRSKLKFEKERESGEEIDKRIQIKAALSNDLTTLDTWKKLAISKHGLVGDDLRATIWPLLLEVPSTDEQIPSLEDLSTHPEYQQVVLDVDRSLKRFPPGIPYKQRLALQDQLTVLILRVIQRYPKLNYYQGYHDVAVTFLLVVGEAVAFRIMEKLSIENLKECMEPTMEQTNYRLQYIYALLHKVDKDLHDYMDRAEVGTMFALPWFLTWFGHSLNRYKDVVRLYDFFLATPHLMPIYVCTALIIHRRDEVFAQDCDMASIHSLLAHIPDGIDFESILESALQFYENHPPAKLDELAKDRINREMAERKRNEERMRNRLKPHRNLLARFNNRIPRWFVFTRWSRMGLLLATALIGYWYYAKYSGQLRHPFMRLKHSSNSSE